MLRINFFSKIIANINSHKLIMLAMLYVACKLTCNPLFFRQINIYYPILDIELKIVSSSLIFPIIYLLSDLIVLISNRKTAIFIIIIGILCDGFFSFSINYATSLPIPDTMSQTQLSYTNAINTLGNKIWKLFAHGLLATITANIVEILLFASIFNKIKSFFLSTVISVFIILIFHNIITDYPMLKSQDDVWSIIFSGLLVNMSIMAMYAAMLSTIICIKHSKTIST